ncbi:MAG: hypothetical protein AMXMBFR13_51240 [Phycisphaerae bacterium]
MSHARVVLVLVIAAGLGAGDVGAEPVADLLEKAAFQEQTAGNLDAAIGLYRQILEQEKARRPLIAQAHFRLGMCLAKKGEKAAAAEQFRIVQSQFADQRELAKLADEELAKMGPLPDGTRQIQTRPIGKPISAFPETTDLSTPESAAAAYHRASATMDPQAVRKLSWRSLDPAELDRVWKQADPADLKVYNQAQLDADIVEVLAYGDDLAAALSLLKFPEGKGRHPYSMRFFGRIGDEWKNLGEDRLPTLEAARANFGRKKEAALREFEQLKPQAGTGAGDGVPRIVSTTPSAFDNKVSPALKEMTVTFDRPMTDGSWSWTGGGETFPKITGKIHYDAARKTCTMPVSLEPGKVYWVGINSPSHRNFTSQAGVPASWYVILFATASADGEVTSLPSDLYNRAQEINAQAAPHTQEDPRVKARQVAEEFLEAAANGNDAAAIKLTDPRMAVGHQVKDFQKIPDIAQTRIESFHADDQAALAITTPVAGDHDRKGPLLITLALSRGLWVVTDVDLGSPEAAKKALDQFMKAHPEALGIPATSRPAGTAMSGDLVDSQTRAEVDRFEKMFAAWFRPESAYEAASDLEQAAMVEKWMHDAQSGDFERRTRAIAALGNVRAKQAVDLLMEIAQEPMSNNRPKWMAVRALGRVANPVAVPVLIELVDYGNLNVKVYAKAALAEITGSYFGEDKEKWRESWKQRGRSVTQDDEATAEKIAARAWQLWGQRKLEEAEKLFRQAAARNPNSANIWNGLGWSQLNQGRPLAGKVAFQRAVDIDPKHPAALNGLGWVAKGQNQVDEAIAYWKRAVEAAPSATASLSGLAATYLERREYDEAARYYRMWLDVEPNSEEAKAGLKQVEDAKSQR